MSFRLLPKDPKFFELFIADGDNLEAAAGALNEIVEQYDRLDERIAGIQALEKAGDEIDRAVTRKLEDAFVTPFDREDIHELVARLDDVVDGIQAIAETFVIYGVTAPTPEARRLAAILDEQGKELAQALRKLDGLKDLERHFEAVHELENEADGLSRAAVAKLFRDDLPPIDVIKWRDLYNYLEEAIDAAEDAAEANLALVVAELDQRWGAHRTVSMRVPLFRDQAGEPMPALFQSLCDLDCYGDLTVWGPTVADGRWVAVSVNQCDGDAPMIMTAVVSHAPITEPAE
jgi:predicted phosphate transport protein (TIGR00153 family)